MKSRLGQTLGAIKVHIYSKAVAHDRVILTQNPKSFDISTPVVRLADVQFVISIPTYIEAKHM